MEYGNMNMKNPPKIEYQWACVMSTSCNDIQKKFCPVCPWGRLVQVEEKVESKSGLLNPSL